MQCPKCNYMMQPFDVDCPRCARMGQSSPVPANPVAAPPQTGSLLKALYLLIGISSLFCVLLIAVLAVRLLPLKEAKDPPVTVQPPSAFTPMPEPKQPAIRNEPAPPIRQSVPPTKSLDSDLPSIQNYLTSLHRFDDERMQIERSETAELRRLTDATQRQQGDATQINQTTDAIILDLNALRNGFNQQQVPSACSELHTKYAAFLTQSISTFQSMRNAMQLMTSNPQEALNQLNALKSQNAVEACRQDADHALNSLCQQHRIMKPFSVNLNS